MTKSNFEVGGVGGDFTLWLINLSPMETRKETLGKNLKAGTGAETVEE